MCGDLDNLEDTPTLAAYRRLAAGLPHDASLPKAAAPASDLPSYMSGLFNSVIARACADAEAASSLDSSLLLAQSVVLARAAGMLAAQMSVREDPLRSVIEAVMDGYAGSQGARADVDLDHHHHHHHDHHDHVHP
jgi:hypothetical protein